MAGEHINLLEECELLINDIGFAVNSISLSKTLPQSGHEVYLNIETKDKEVFTVRLTLQGFQVVSHELDRDQNSSSKYPAAYETIYALLENISPSYVNLFGNALAQKLKALEKQNMEEEEEEERDNEAEKKAEN